MGEEFRYNSQLPAGIRNGLRMRKRNKKIVQLDFAQTAEFPDEEAFWEWLEKGKFTDIEGMDMDYIEREVLERKYYICMKNEEAAKLMEEQFKEDEVIYTDKKHEDHRIIAKQMGDIVRTITVRGVHPNTEIGLTFGHEF